MEKQFLLPHKYKKVGWILLMLGLALYIFAKYIIKEYWEKFSFLNMRVLLPFYKQWNDKTEYFSFQDVNITFTLIGALIIIGGLIISFSKEKVEDEYIMVLRIASFQWAFLINYILLFLMFIFVYGADFLLVYEYFLFTILALFILRFHYLLKKSKL